MQVVKTLGSRIGPTVVVALGYNEFEDQFARNVQVTLDAFENAGAKQVLWLTLRAARHPYVNMNDALVAAAATHPSLVVVDWNLYSRSHADWFQSDGIHLLNDGSTAHLPDAKRGKAYAGPPRVAPFIYFRF
jgi:hypothetical protein